MMVSLIYQEVNVTDKTTGATLTENVHYTLEYSGT